MKRPPARAVFRTLLIMSLIATAAPFADAQSGYKSFVRGDANIDGMVNLADGIRVLDYLFLSASLDCMDAADTNDDESVNIADPIVLFAYLFLFAPPPPAPFPACGPDPTNDLVLGCLNSDICAPPTDRAAGSHILRRIAYGPTPTELIEIETIGADTFIATQLDPLSIPENPQVAAKIAALPISATYVNYYRHVLIRGRYSNRQLLEQMTDFWSNHFNTYFWTLRGFLQNLDGGSVYDGGGLPDSRIAAMELESAEDEAFRTLALGSFEDLVIASATSPTMLVYLDNISNIAGDPNENYARELLELHTVGVGGGYSQNDVEQVARVFTGWTICKVDPVDVGDPHAACLPNNSTTGVWSFHFEPANHDYGAKSLFTNTSYPLSIPAGIPGGLAGVDEGFEVIAHLAVTSQTAQYVSTKLIQKFVSDEPPLSLVAACIGTWLGTGGEVGAVMQTILDSAEFRGTTYRWNKVKTPMESMLATVRMLEGETTNAQQILVAVANLSHVVLNFGTPDGYPEVGNDWIGTSKLVDTVHFNEIIYQGSSELTYDPRLIQLAANPSIDESNPTEVVTFWLELMLPEGYNPIDEAIALDFFSTGDLGNPLGNPLVLVPGTPAYDLHLRKFLTFLRSWPQAMKQ